MPIKYSTVLSKTNKLSIYFTKKIAGKLIKWGDTKYYKNEPDFRLKFLKN